MHKLIKKYQGGMSLLATPKTGVTVGAGPDMDAIIKSFNKNISSIPKSTGSAAVNGSAGFSGVGMSLLAEAPQAIDTGLQAFGAKKADVSGGYEAAEGVASSIGKIGLNPQLLAATGGLSALAEVPDLLLKANRYLGKTSAKQGTESLDTGGYSKQISTQAGKKQTFTNSNTLGGIAGTAAGFLVGGVGGAALGNKLGTKLFGGKTKLDKINATTARADRANLLAGSAAYSNKTNMESAQNTFGDIAMRDRQKLLGGVSTNLLSAAKGAKLRNIKNKANTNFNKKKVQVIETESDVTKFEAGGKMNVIPDGALHARKHTLPEDIAEKVTDKGIPVITYDEGGEITQHAEIELNEIIFQKETTNKLEDYFKQYNESKSEKEKADIAIECGKFLTLEILENTDDKTGLLNTVE